MIKFKICKKSEYLLLNNFIKKNWPKKTIITKNKYLFEWLYLDKKKKRYNFITSRNKNKILSCIGFFKNEVIIKKKKKGLIWLSFWLSKKNKYLSSGIDLYYYLVKKYKNHIIGTIGLNQNTIPIYKSLGFNVGKLNHFYILNPDLKRFFLISHKNSSKRYIKTKDKLFIEINSKVDFYRKSDFKKYEKIYYKNLNYFKSKYQDNPFYNYNFYVIKNKTSNLAFFIGRECTYKRNKSLRYVEFFGSEKILKHIKFNLIKLLTINKYEYIDFYNYGINVNLIKSAGFSINNFTKKIVIPNYYEPFVKKNIKINFAYYPPNKKFPMFKGDCDQDRPNIIN